MGSESGKSGIEAGSVSRNSGIEVARAGAALETSGNNKPPPFVATEFAVTDCEYAVWAINRKTVNATLIDVLITLALVKMSAKCFLNSF